MHHTIGTNHMGRGFLTLSARAAERRRCALVPDRMVVALCSTGMFEYEAN